MTELDKWSEDGIDKRPEFSITDYHEGFKDGFELCKQKVHNEMTARKRRNMPMGQHFFNWLSALGKKRHEPSETTESRQPEAT